MKKISVKDLNESAVKLFDSDWSLITSGDEASGYNTMTASWGGIGELWNRDVCFIFVRPQRYTYEFLEKNDLFTVSFYAPEYKKALAFCGSRSGRDVDKAKETGLTPLFLDGTTTFKQARLTIVCRKIAFQDLDPSGFVDKEIDADNYPSKDYHRMYVGEILHCIEH